MRQKSLDKRLQSERRQQVRKEKSKEAARSRREKEGDVFTELISTLPVDDAIKGNLDKTTIIRLCINYIRSRNITGNLCMPDIWDTDVVLALEEAMEVLHGFVLLLSPTAEVVYVTSNIKQILGMCEYDLVGRSLEAFIHRADWEETKERMKPSSSSLGFCARFKSNLSSRSRGTNFKSSSYKTMRFSGRRLAADVKPEDGLMSECVLLTATPVEHPSMVRVPLDSMTFTSKHQLDMRFTDCDTQATDLTRYEKPYMVDKSFYDFIHPSDIKAVVADFKSLMSKEHIVTDPYRFLTSGGGYVRMCTQASVATDSKTSKSLHILCVHRTISEAVEAGVIMADIQMADSVTVKAEKVVSSSCGGTVKPLSTADEVASRSEEEYVLDDILDATAGVFMDPVDDHCDLDIMRDTESIFGDDPGIGGISGALGNVDVNAKPGKTTLEALVEELDNDTIDMNRGLFVDLPDVDAKDYYLRAPYIPMEDFSDMPMIDSWCYDEPTSLPANKQDDWNLYRQEENQRCTSALPSPVTSTSPSKSTDSSSPATTDSPPWLIDNDNGDLISDLAQLTYAENDHDGYSKSVDTDFSSLPDIKDCYNERLAFTNSDLQQPSSTAQTWSTDTYMLHNVSSGTNMAEVPSITSLSYQAPQGQQYGYTRRKRKVGEQFGSEYSQVKAHGLDLNSPTETAYKTARIRLAEDRDGGQNPISGPDTHSTAYAAGDRPGVRYIRGNISKTLPPVNVIKVVGSSNTGWLATASRTDRISKYKPPQQNSSCTTIDRDKKSARDSLLLDLLQQT